MTTYYNDNDPFCAAWLANLKKAGLISDGVIDSRSIAEVKADDLRGHQRCHFFAGIAGWELALQFAGWPEDKTVWTGSCPCQPFSSAGKHRGVADERHLWPIWRKLIAECRPPVVFGEQVSSPLALAWLDGVFDDLEAEGYACAALDLPACSVGAPHIRQRLWWVADSGGIGRGDVGENRKMQRSGLHKKSPFAWVIKPPHLPKPVELSRTTPTSGVVRLDDGLSECMAGIHAVGNAIVPQLAAAFIKAWMTR